jgi:methionyl-tRNA formyltransferase
MKEIGARVLVETVKGLSNGTLKEIPQHVLSDGDPRKGGAGSKTKHAPKIFTETCKIDFTKTVDEVHNLIRGLSPFPGAFTFLNARQNGEDGMEKMLKIYRSEKEDGVVNIAAGNYATDAKTFLKFACANGYILVKELQAEGKKKMNVEEFLRGYRFNQ